MAIDVHGNLNVRMLREERIENAMLVMSKIKRNS